ncbi:ATP-binding cassette domain-containing protein [Marinomonas agarivorans]|nr:ATP-binding cassette domain-containing protein [Marinomonas agarivorans]
MLDLKRCQIKINSTVLLDDFSFHVNNGEVLSIMGPSGCGKSTLLGYLSGTLSHDFIATGQIELDGKPIQQLNTIKRKVGILYQSPLLFPHMTNLENLLFATPSNKNTSHKERVEMAMGKLNELGLETKAHELPEVLSGGQQARIALLRALLAEPQYLLLDEPFSKLDPELRQSVRSFTLEQIQKANIPTVLVTHDMEDAQAMQSKIITLQTQN